MLYHCRTPYHEELTVYDTDEHEGERGRFRVLQFSDEAVQGVMDLTRPDRILFEYPRAMIHLIEHNHGPLREIFIVGHGIGSLARHYEGQPGSVTVAELDPEVDRVSRQYFGYSGNNVVIGDGRRILERTRQERFDCILLDAFTSSGTPRQLLSLEFFGLVRSKLDPQGSVILNLMGRSEHDPVVNAVSSTLQEEFAFCSAFALPGKGAAGKQSILLAAANRPLVYQSRHMAGFMEIAPGAGYIITDP
ncbi:spermidine synthase [Gorillibacterium sp. sgz5001074]|uniref:spermidine synthase n=1 Tax=Gorillibacterium sp. sgz5001074 TaxID=3446695 RepID=UPI003F667074